MEQKTKFTYLFQAGQIGTMTMKNRIVKPATATNLGSPEGFVTEKLIDFYEETAKGGVGLVTVEILCVDSPSGKMVVNQLGIDDDRYLPALQKLTKSVHNYGAKVAAQLHHAGRRAKSTLTGIQPVAPSAIPAPAPGQEVPRELTTEEVKDLVNHFAEAGVRAKQAGFDAIEIHAAHGYLFTQFLSPASNKRRDAYGGNLENRARFLLQVIEAIKERVGRDFPVWPRIDAVEFNGDGSMVDGGITLEQSREVARLAEQAGADAIHVTAGGFFAAHSAPWVVQGHSYPPSNLPDGFLIPLAADFKKVVSVPVIAVGRITPRCGEKALQEDKADFVAIARGLIADPDLPRKASEGRLEDIRPCIMCHACRSPFLYSPKDAKFSCSVNARMGKGSEFDIVPTVTKRKVFVIGGGPAGMEAARVAALRGHHVTLYEKGPQLGGQMLLAVIPPHKEPLKDLINYLSTQTRKVGVRIELNKEATPETVKMAKPDAVIVATGAISYIPDVTGIGRKNVVLATDVLTGKANTGNSVVIIGGELVGCETAEFLAEKGKKVTVVRRGQEMATKVDPSLRPYLLERLNKLGVRLLPGIREYKEITKDGLRLIDQYGKEQLLAANTIVLAAGSQSNRKLFDDLKGKVKHVYLVGDSSEPRRILEAIHEGYSAGLQIE